MRLLSIRLNWGLCPQAPRIYRFFFARMGRFSFRCLRATWAAALTPFRPLNRSLGLLPSIALSRPPQVIPGWAISTSPCNNVSANGDNPLNFVSHSMGSLQSARDPPVALLRPTILFRLRLAALRGRLVACGGFAIRLFVRRDRTPLIPYPARNSSQTPDPANPPSTQTAATRNGSGRSHATAHRADGTAETPCPSPDKTSR